MRKIEIIGHLTRIWCICWSMTKKCTGCQEDKNLEAFDLKKTGKHGRRSQCKECRKKDHELNKEVRNTKRQLALEEKRKDPEFVAKERAISKAWYEAHKDVTKQYAKENKDKINEKRRMRYPQNRDKLILRATTYRNENIDKVNARRKELRMANLDDAREYEREYSRARRETDIQYRILGNLRGRIRMALENKSESTKDLLGCDLGDFVKHLESQFTPEMSWENYGTYWSIDHIIPCCSFDLTDIEQQYKCFHWSNCRPLTVIENSRKATQDKKKKIKADKDPNSRV